MIYWFIIHFYLCSSIANWHHVELPYVNAGVSVFFICGLLKASVCQRLSKMLFMCFKALIQDSFVHNIIYKNFTTIGQSTTTAGCSRPSSGNHNLPVQSYSPTPSSHSSPVILSSKSSSPLHLTLTRSPPPAFRSAGFLNNNRQR